MKNLVLLCRSERGAVLLYVLERQTDNCCPAFTQALVVYDTLQFFEE